MKIHLFELPVSINRDTHTHGGEYITPAKGGGGNKSEIALAAKLEETGSWNDVTQS